MGPVDPENVFLMTFPPFPSAPPGVAIVPFKDFKEHGISAERDQLCREVDGLGVPTVFLPIREDPDWDYEWDDCQHRATALHRSDRKQWWEYWSECDNRRGPFAFNPQLPKLDKIYIALASFRGSRRWPSERNETPGPKYFWEQFRIFIGASGYPPTWNRTDRQGPKGELNQVSPDYSDDEGDNTSGPQASTVIRVSTNQNLNGRGQYGGPVRPPYAYFNVKPVNIDSDEAVRALLDLDRLRREEHLIDFLEDPEKFVKVFLSSYSRQQGFWWVDVNLDIMPRVLCFFFKFLLKNCIFTDTVDELKIQAALKVAESGHKELPLTSIIAKFLPDQFGFACRQYWGIQRKRSAWSDDEDDNTINELYDGINDAGLSDHTDISAETTKFSLEEGENGDRMVTVLPLKRPQVPEMFKTLFTPTNAFPTTHVLGFVEQSLRRIKYVLPPGRFVSAHAKSCHPEHDTVINSTDVVERDLEIALVKVVLVPWIGSGLDGFDQPEILRYPSYLPNEDDLDSHDPLEDEITVLFSFTPKQLGALRDAVGMAIAGTWVQICPIGLEGADPRRLRYWYLEETILVVPSFEAHRGLSPYR